MVLSLFSMKLNLHSVSSKWSLIRLEADLTPSQLLTLGKIYFP